MTNTEQKHTPGPIEIEVIETADLLSYAIIGCQYLSEKSANARLLAAGYNAFDSAAARLNLNAVDLAEQMLDGGIADLVEALKLAKQQMIQTGVVFGLSVMQRIDVALVKAGAV